MESWAFWTGWPSTLKRLFLLAAGLVAALMVLSIGLELAGHSLVLDWYLTTETETIRVPLKAISVGLFEIEIPADVLLVRQYFEGSPWLISPWGGMLYLTVLFFFYSLLIALSTYLPRFWYFVASAVFIGLLVSMRLEQLLIFGWFDYKPLALAILLFLPLSYYFHAFNKYIPLERRVLAFVGSFALLALLIGVGAQASRPFYTLAQYNYLAPVLITIAFAFLVGHEVVFFILKMITRGKPQEGSKNWIHFFSFSIFYLVNVALVYAHNARYVTWDILYLNEFLILAVAAGLGLWGIKAREQRYEDTAPFNPIVSLFYLSMAGIAIATISYQLFQRNDPVLETFEDAIVFSQLGFGAMFLLYVIVNFITPLMRNLPVYRIVFKEGALPYPTYRLAGLAAVAAFYFLSNQAALNQAISGSYNSLGDLYNVREEGLLSEQYYLQGALYGYSNHKSNYNLGFIANSKEKAGEAIYRFGLASGKNPSPHAFVNLGNQYQDTRQLLKGIFALQGAKMDFETNGYINNNLGALFAVTNLQDSALLYLKNAMDSGFPAKVTKRAAQANVAYLAFKSGVQYNYSEIEASALSDKSYGFLANAFATCAGKQNPALTQPVFDLVPDSVVSGLTFPFVYNAALINIENPENVLSTRLPAMVEASANVAYYVQLSMVMALDDYFSGDVAKAIQTLNRIQLAYPSSRAYCYHLLSAIHLDQGAALRAAELFEQADAEQYAGSGLNQAIALSEADYWQQAQLKWILLERDSLAGPIAASVLDITEVQTLDELTTDQQRYQYARWFGASLDDEGQEALVASFENKDMKKASMAALARLFFVKGDWANARKIAEDPLLSGWTNAEFMLLQLYLQLNSGGVAVLPGNRLIDALPSRQGKVLEEVAAAVAKEDIEAMKKAVQINAFHAPLMLALSDYLLENDTEESAYEILVLALEANPFSIEVLKRYTFLAMDMGFENYAENALIRLVDLLPAEQYSAFEREFDKKMEEREAENSGWNFD